MIVVPSRARFDERRFAGFRYVVVFICSSNSRVVYFLVSHRVFVVLSLRVYGRCWTDRLRVGVAPSRDTRGGWSATSRLVECPVPDQKSLEVSTWPLVSLIRLVGWQSRWMWHLWLLVERVASLLILQIWTWVCGHPRIVCVVHAIGTHHAARHVLRSRVGWRKCLCGQRSSIICVGRVMRCKIVRCAVVTSGWEAFDRWEYLSISTPTALAFVDTFLPWINSASW
jgi:hypothetical protein